MLLLIGRAPEGDRQGGLDAPRGCLKGARIRGFLFLPVPRTGP